MEWSPCSYSPFFRFVYTSYFYIRGFVHYRKHVRRRRRKNAHDKLDSVRNQIIWDGVWSMKMFFYTYEPPFDFRYIGTGSEITRPIGSSTSFKSR